MLNKAPLSIAHTRSSFTRSIFVFGFVLLYMCAASLAAQSLSILSGNQFSSTEDFQKYGGYEYYASPRAGVSYVYGDQVYTGGDEMTNDASKTKLSSGKVSSVDADQMLYVGNTSGVTVFTVTYDLRSVCAVDRVDVWALCGLDTQIKKLTFSISEDGSNYTNVGTILPEYPSGDSVMQIQQDLSTPQHGRYVKILVEEQSLDYTGDWSYRVSLGEVVILGSTLSIEPDPEDPPLGPRGVLSGNVFASNADAQSYGSLEYFSSPRTGVSYSYEDAVYTGGGELVQDPYHAILNSGCVESTDASEMLYLGDTSGVTQIAVVYDLGVECEVDTVDAWVFCGAGTQIKKVTSYISSNGQSYASMDSSIVAYPNGDGMVQVSQSPDEPMTGRYVKVVIEERSLDYLGDWSYTASIGEIVVIGRAPDVYGPVFLLSDNALRATGSYNTSMLQIDTGASYQWMTQEPFATDSSLIASDEDDANDAVGGQPDLTDGSDIQTDASMVCSSATGLPGTYAAVRFDLKDVYEISEIDVWTLADSNSYMDGYEVLLSNDGSHYTSLGFTVNANPRNSDAIVNTWTGGVIGQNARYVKIVLHNANDSQQLTVGEIAIWGTRPYDVTLPVNAVPEQVTVQASLKNYSKLFLDWSDYNHVVNDVNQYKVYIETQDFRTVSGLSPVIALSTGSKGQIGKVASYFALEPETTYYIAVSPISIGGIEREDVTPLILVTPGVMDTTGKMKHLFNINDPAYGAGQYTQHADEWSNMLMKADLLKELEHIQKNRWFNHDNVVMDQYGRRDFAFHLFYNDPSKLSFDNSWGVWSFSSYNEPDLANRDVNVVRATLSSNYSALKAADSRNILFEPALGDTNTAGLSWLEDLYNSDGQNGAELRTYFDVMDVHAYCKYADPYPAGLTHGVPEALIGKIDALRTLMASHGDGNKPIVFTELGWSTYTGGAYLKAVDKPTQRNYLVRSHVISAAKDIKAIWWHNFQDNGTSAGSIEHQFGIIDWYGKPKPAYYGYYIMSKVLAEAVYDDVLNGVNHPNYGYQFRDEAAGVYITALWAADEVNRVASLSTSDSGLKVVGVDGSFTYVQAHAGLADVALSGAPVFIYSTSPLFLYAVN
ncbi:hypothetical protein SH580_15840 [Coraliomargarita algicola]|uniref:F5/8 type C domain-containing protein n=1 Tax=Coraliomargarita algicola TaxID=3092156 RepID=A0ABZ0RH80_9BACT|nr:hypothetical protein [Coraliomargarita sp. J2-16]WPJ94902.1 hypothetical protein SH580_15840 [Coraliomargarita sp. J2-16]